MSGFADLARLGRQALESGVRALVAQVVEVEGSSYRRPGARMVLTECGESAGSISAGCLEADLARRLPAVCANGRPELVEYDSRLSQDLVWGIGLGCGGRVTILLTPVEEGVVSRLEQIDRHLAAGQCLRIETPWGSQERLVEELEPPIELLVCGTGSDAFPMIRQGLLLGWSVSVVTPRPASEAAKRLAEHARIPIYPAEELDRLAVRPNAAAVVMTHNFLDDCALLGRLLGTTIGYVGVLGPRERTQRLRRALDLEAATPDLEARLYSPVGLDVGAETPEEIALAIAAEISAVFRRGNGRPLRSRVGPIHTRADAGSREVLAEEISVG